MADIGAGASVRHSVRADLPGIVEIYNSTVPSRQVTADTEPVTVASREPWFDAHSPGRYPLWVLEDAGGTMLGWISLSAFYGRPAYASTAEVSIYLAEAARGRGLGRLALDYALDACPALGIRTLLGFIFAHNTPSMALFERRGFSTWGHFPDVAELDGVRRSLVILGLALPQPKP